MKVPTVYKGYNIVENEDGSCSIRNLINIILFWAESHENAMHKIDKIYLNRDETNRDLFKEIGNRPVQQLTQKEYFHFELFKSLLCESTLSREEISYLINETDTIIDEYIESQHKDNENYIPPDNTKPGIITLG